MAERLTEDHILRLRAVAAQSEPYVVDMVELFCDEIERLKAENETLTGIIREEDGARLRHIEELEAEVAEAHRKVGKIHAIVAGNFGDDSDSADHYNALRDISELFECWSPK